MSSTALHKCWAQEIVNKKEKKHIFLFEFDFLC